MSVICVVSLCIVAVFGFPDGAPVDACVKSRPNQPNHGSARPQEPHTRPYRVIASHQHYGPGSQITGNRNNSYFIDWTFILEHDSEKKLVFFS